MSTDMKLSEFQSGGFQSKIIKSGGFLGNMIGNLGKKSLIDLGVSLAKFFLPESATKAALPVIGKFERRLSV